MSEVIVPISNEKHIKTMDGICKRAGISEVECPSMSDITENVNKILTEVNWEYYETMDPDACDKKIMEAINVLKAAREFNRNFGF